MKRLYIFGVITSVILIGMAGGHFYLFREEVEDNPALGLLFFRYRWGFAHEIAADANRDGIIDAKYLIKGGFGEFKASDPFLEAWESHQCDGTMDIHMIFDPPQQLSVIEYDHDKNGDFEVVLHGTKAEEFLKTLEREGCQREGK